MHKKLVLSFLNRDFEISGNVMNSILQVSKFGVATENLTFTGEV